MLLFSTILDIASSMTREGFISLVMDWNQTSKYPGNIIPEMKWHGEPHIRFGKDKLWLSIDEYRKENILAVRYEKEEDDGSIWDTDYVMNFDAMRMSVRLDRSYTEEALSMDPKFSTPHFITLLEQRGYLREDGDLPVSREPMIIGEDQLPLLSSIILGEKRYPLPVVFVSKTREDEDPVDVKWLASRLKGAAHVLVQEKHSDGYLLRDLCYHRNEYNGACGIYYPNPSFGHQRYLYYALDGYDSTLMEKIIRSVIQYCNAQRTDPLYTWQGVSHAILRETLEQQRRERQDAETARKKAEDETLFLMNALDEEEQKIRRKALEEARMEADKILDEFDNHLAYLQNQIEELTKANEILQYENQGMKNKLDTLSNVPLIFMGEEKEFYPGEVRDLLLVMLKEVDRDLSPDTRRSDVLKDLLRQNESRRSIEQKSEAIRKLMKNYDGMTPVLRQTLEDLGFVITEDGKHYKLTYYGDDRYQIILSKTPGDVRTGKNSVQKLINKVF